MKLTLFELREAETEDIDESAPAEARAAAVALDGVIAMPTLPKGLRAQLRAARAGLRKRLSLWSDLAPEGEDDGEGEGGDPPKATEAEVAAFSGIPLEEATKGDGEFDVRIIAPGWGSSGYYSPDALKKAAEAKVFSKGLKSFWDHPTKSEERERPERSLRDLAGVLTEDARWEDAGAEGPGLYGRVKLTGQYREAVKELAPHIGLSIRATGAGREGEAEGRKGRIIEAIVGAKSVDFVTAPGAGGKVISLFEAARNHQSQEDDMDLQEAIAAKEKAETDLAEAKRAAEADRAELARYRERILISEADTLVTSKLASVKLPDVTKARLRETVSAKAQAKDGKLDEAAIESALAEAIKAETTYLESIVGKGRITGMGGGTSEESEGNLKEAQDKLADALGVFGLSENGVKIAVNGRGR